MKHSSQKSIHFEQVSYRKNKGETSSCKRRFLILSNFLLKKLEIRYLMQGKTWLVIVVQGSLIHAKKTIEAGNKQGDLFEFRLDLFEDLRDVLELKNQSTLPVIFTLRTTHQGGSFKGSKKDYEKTLFKLLNLRPAYVDLEYGLPFSFIEKIQKNYPHISTIYSYHHFKKTPDLDKILTELRRVPSHFYKIATFANSSIDALRLLLFTQTKRQENIPLIAVCMGNHGQITRILAPVVGSLFNYLPLEEKEQTAPGQIDLTSLEKIYHYSCLNQNTKIYALIGDPVDKSIGHLVHNQAFKKLGENRVYVKIKLEGKEVPSFFSLMKKLPFYGLSVTMPLKEKLQVYLAEIDVKAKKIGAVNTLALKQGKWKGFNTDAKGALDAIETHLSVYQKKMVVLGAGGTAKAVTFEALQRGAQVLLVNRSGEKAKELALYLGCRFSALDTWDGRGYDILVNTTSVGMAPKTHVSPIPKSHIEPRALVFDAIFNPKETKLLFLAFQKGCQIVYGFEMFAKQAIGQLEIWLDENQDQKALFSMIEKIYQNFFPKKTI